jgi:hypothetical protein
MPHFPMFQLAIVLAEAGFLFALVSLKPVEEMPQTFAIDDLAWIDMREKSFESRGKTASPRGTVGYE